MNEDLKRFGGGVAFLALGAMGLLYRAKFVPDPTFRGHVLAGPEGGVAVEMAGWLGVGSGILCVIGLAVAYQGVRGGIASGSLEAWITERLPKKKVPEGEDEGEESDE